MNSISDLKQSYQHISVPPSMVENEWEELLSALPSRQRLMLLAALRTGMIVILALFFISSGVIGAAQASRPGSPLYPIKKLSSQTFTAVKEKLTPKEKQPATIKTKPSVLPTSTLVPSPVQKRADEVRNNEQHQNQGQGELHRNDNAQKSVQGASDKENPSGENKQKAQEKKETLIEKQLQNATEKANETVKDVKDTVKSLPKGLRL